jgi:hypothetical protein
MSRDKDVDNPTVPASDQTQGTSDGGTGTTSGSPEDRSGAAAESDLGPAAGNTGGHSPGGEVY